MPTLSKFVIIIFISLEITPLDIIQPQILIHTILFLPSGLLASLVDPPSMDHQPWPSTNLARKVGLINNLFGRDVTPQCYRSNYDKCNQVFPSILINHRVPISLQS